MQFSIVTRGRAKEVLNAARILNSSTTGRTRIHIAEHDGLDVLVIVPHQGPDVFVIGNADHCDPHGHGCNMHNEYRELGALEAAHAEQEATK